MSEGLAGRSGEIRLVPRSMERCRVVARRGGSIRLRVQAGTEDHVDVSYTLEGPTSRTSRRTSVLMQEGVATLIVHGLDPGAYAVSVVVGERSPVVESVDVTSGRMVPVTISE